MNAKFRDTIIKLAATVVLFGVLATVSMGYNAIKAYYSIGSCTVETTATISNAYLSGSEPQQERWRIILDYEVDGEEYQISEKLPRDASPEVGDEVRVYYNENDPRSAYAFSRPEDDFREYLLAAEMTGGISLMALFIYLWLKRMAE